MKNLGLFCLLLSFIALESCNKKAKEKELEAEKIETVDCYKALYEKDTIDLKINTLENGKITGDMVMKIIDMPEKTGKITGEFHGDTLFVDYSFIQGKNDKVMFKNPLALLKRDNELILGNGKIETYLGESYFAKGIPIDFEKVKYKFSKVDCVVKE